jgi:glycosyltransferase involved in cell wall biosynthesis
VGSLIAVGLSHFWRDTQLREMTAKRVGLVMIVKDEEANVERALRSALPYITTWVIVDTGSTDGTKGVIQRVMDEAGVTGHLYDRPWVDFGHNRTEALTLCDTVMDWAIMLDADDNLAGPSPPASVWEQTNMDGFVIRIHHGNMRHYRVHVFRTGIGWTYEGVLHESPVCKGKAQATVGILGTDIYMETRCEGVRARNPRKYLDDAELLERQPVRNARTVFYIAQSYRDAGMKERALMYYKQYVQMADGSPSDRYLAYMNIVLLTEVAAEQTMYGWAGVELNPKRLEIPFVLMQRFRTEGRKLTQELYAMAAACSGRSITVDMLLVNPMVYEWAYDDEFSVVAFATGHYKESYEASLRVAMNAPVSEVRLHAMDNAKKTQGLIGCS